MAAPLAAIASTSAGAGAQLANYATAASAGASAATGIAGLFGPSHKKRTERQIAAQKQMNEDAAALNYEYSEKSAVNAQKRGEEMYLKYESPEAMRRQYEEAHLNPALMYGMNGAGGASVDPGAQGNPGSQQGGRAANAAEQQMADTQKMAMGLQLSSGLQNLAKLKAEVENINADTKLKNKDVETKDVEQTEMNTNILQTLQGIENMKVEKAGMELQNEYDKTRNFIQEETKDEVIGTAEWGLRTMQKNYEKLVYETLESNADSYIKVKTMNDQIEIIKNQKANIIADTLLKYSQANLNEKEADAVADYVAIGYLNGNANDLNARTRIAELLNMPLEKSMSSVWGFLKKFGSLEINSNMDKALKKAGIEYRWNENEGTFEFIITKLLKGVGLKK